jgi:pimeloyl-ACP methyl ester carboxylesterase
VFALWARGDRIVGNQKVRAYLDSMFRSPRNRFVEVDGGHAVQFEQPAELAAGLLEFMECVTTAERGGGLPPRFAARHRPARA